MIQYLGKAWSDTVGCCSVNMERHRQVNRTLRTEVIQCIDCLDKQPDLEKYEYVVHKDQNNCTNVKRLVASTIYGGSVLSQRMRGKKHLLQKCIEADQSDTLPRVKSLISVNPERFYVLENV